MRKARSRQPGEGPKAHGGDGTSLNSAVVIGGDNILVGTEAEYAHIARLCGRQGLDWNLVRQSTFRNRERTYDQIEVRLSDGQQRIFYFDITGLLAPHPGRGES